MRFRWLVIPGLVLAGCGANNGPITRAAGSWPGEFSIDTVDHHSDPKAIEREVMKGNLELYVTGRKFELNMTARHQGFTVLGTWSAERTGRVTMVANKYSFDNPTDEDQKALGLRIIQPDEIRAVFRLPFVLDESPDKRRLTGLEVTLGKLTGRFQFERPIPR